MSDIAVMIFVFLMAAFAFHDELKRIRVALETIAKRKGGE